ncbi:ATP-dependent DNA helicase RecG [Candidatus Dojkabacteria bacterium]|uniref:ATP-dependent DNA helicase RecG n=1 Tax=Candidatus Dojkabacteria bacterium TaxID=2099670 RepID=A0A955L0A1_9BACT|nr:ATP-dependent DNA helicase RecG [Candidatus Dojkabacteria bacterium]
MNLSDSVTSLKYVSSSYSEKLDRLGIKSVKNLLTYFPRSYTDSSHIDDIYGALIKFKDGVEEFTIKAKVDEIKSIRLRGGNRTLQNGQVSDKSGSILIQFFNQPYLTKALKYKQEYLFKGKIKQKGNQFTFYPTVFEEVKEEEESIHLGRISPEYALTAGVTKKWFRNRVKQALDLLKDNEIDLKELDNIDSLVKTNTIVEYLNELHFPENEKTLAKAHDALALLEMADVHLKVKNRLSKEIKKYEKLDIAKASKDLKTILKQIPFELTEDQNQVVSNLVEQLQDKKLINCLIQGDVGSGKTIVSFILAYIFAKQGIQAAILVPTTVLARQHFDNAKKLFSFDKDIIVDMASTENKKAEKSNLLIGTTAIIHRNEHLIDNLGLIVVDEQHRFGVTQREFLLNNLKQKKTPHYIDMTATPIPRSITEVFFSDIDVFSIKSKPKDRKRIKSYLVPSNKRKDGYRWIKDKILSEGNQAFWVCPLIDNSEAITSKSVKEIYTDLKKNLPDLKIEYLHGKMKKQEKEAIMKQFSENKFHILVSTTVIEVGVDVPNATIMVIENGERFGLAQLHQIRGRVGRGSDQSYCFVFTDDLPEAGSEKEASDRLHYFVSEHNGLKIAEFDLQSRGPGEVYGTKQSGIPNLKLAKLTDLGLIKKSKSLAEKAYNSGITEISLFN